MRAGSPMGAAGYAVDTWCDPWHESGRLAHVVRAGLGLVGEGARVGDPHIAHGPWVERVLDRGALALPRAVLGPDLAIESGELLLYRAGQSASVPVHQRGHGPGLLLDPRYALGAMLLLAHDGPSPWARLAPHTSGAGYLPHDHAADGGILGPRPRLLRSDGRRWHRAEPAMAAGGVVYTDLRTLASYGTAASWLALSLVLIAPGAIVDRPVDAPPVRRLCGSASHWAARPNELPALRGVLGLPC